MPNYRYRVLLENGQIRRGKIVATDKTQAIDRLKSGNSQPIYIKRVSKLRKKYRIFSFNRLERLSRQSATRTLNNIRRTTRRKINLKEMTVSDFKALLTPINLLTTFIY